MAYVIVEVKGLNEILQQLRAFADATRNLQEIRQKVGQYVLDFLTNDVFESEGKVFGHGWPELSMPYAYRKYLKYGPQLTLIATGKMRASNVLYTTGEMITIKNNAQNEKGEYYAAKHQYGVGVPQRILYDLGEEQKDRIGAIIMEGIERRIEKG